MDTLSGIDQFECPRNNYLKHESGVFLISTLWSLILLGFHFSP